MFLNKINQSIDRSLFVNAITNKQQQKSLAGCQNRQ